MLWGGWDIKAPGERRIFFKSIDGYDENITKDVAQYYRKFERIDASQITLPDNFEYTFNKLIKLKDKGDSKIFSTSSRLIELKRYDGYSIRNILFAEVGILEKNKRLLYSIMHYRTAKKNTLKLFKYYDSIAVEADYTKKYIYYALHYTPECTSSPQGGRVYSDQYISISILSSSVPEDVYIYVKEHPTQTSYGREKELYDRIRKLKNVVFVDINTDNYELIRNSIAVASLTGTSLIECAIFNKPGIMFGWFITQYAPWILHIRTVQECKAAIRSILQGSIKDTTFKDVKIFMKYISEKSYLPKEISDSDYISMIKDYIV